MSSEERSEHEILLAVAEQALEIQQGAEPVLAAMRSGDGRLAEIAPQAGSAAGRLTELRKELPTAGHPGLQQAADLLDAILNLTPGFSPLPCPSSNRIFRRSRSSANAASLRASAPRGRGLPRSSTPSEAAGWSCLTLSPRRAGYRCPSELRASGSELSTYPEQQGNSRELGRD